MNIEPIIQRAAVVARNASLSLTTLAGPGCAERVLTALILAYAQELSAIASPERAGEILYVVADSVATGETMVLPT